MMTKIRRNGISEINISLPPPACAYAGVINIRASSPVQPIVKICGKSADYSGASRECKLTGARKPREQGQYLSSFQMLMTAAPARRFGASTDDKLRAAKQ